MIKRKIIVNLQNAHFDSHSGQLLHVNFTCHSQQYVRQLYWMHLLSWRVLGILFTFSNNHITWQLYMLLGFNNSWSNVTFPCFCHKRRWLVLHLCGQISILFISVYVYETYLIIAVLVRFHAPLGWYKSKMTLGQPWVKLSRVSVCIQLVKYTPQTLN